MCTSVINQWLERGEPEPIQRIKRGITVKTDLTAKLGIIFRILENEILISLH